MCDPVGLAVSGGSDSTALLVLAREWALQSGRHIVALTVDHGLRDESAEEARQVAALCERLGILHESARWMDPVGRQASARRARHRMLAEMIKRYGGNGILLGHTLDDQCETYLMRKRQDSSWYGLAAMPVQSLSPVWPEGEGIRIGRPLIHLGRQALREFLSSAGYEWVDDPSNENDAYERVRVRAELTADAALTKDISAALVDLHRQRREEDAALGHLLKMRVQVSTDGHLVAELDKIELEQAARFVNLLLQIAAGRDVPPRRENLMFLTTRLLSDDDFPGATLHRVIVKRKNRQTTMIREGEPLGKQVISERLAGLTGFLQSRM